MKAAPIIRLRGIRQIIPSGYVMGRISPGDGDPELIPVSMFAAKQAATGIIQPVAAPAPYVFGWSLDGPFTTSQQFEGAPSVYDLNFPSTVISAWAGCGVAPTADTHIYLATNLAALNLSGASAALATITFTAGATTGTFAWASTTLVTAHTVPYLVMAETFDTTFAQVRVLIAADP